MKKANYEALNRNGAVIYCRVSSKEQVQNFSLETQEKSCRGFCHAKEYEILRVFIEEGESARTTNRTRFQEMITYILANKGRLSRVVVHNLTRFSRQAADYHAVRAVLAKVGIRLESVTEAFDDSPGGRLMEGVIAQIAQFDNDVRAQRTILGMMAAVEKGRWPFNVSLGYLRGGKEHGCSLRIDPIRGPLIKQAFEAIASGTMNANDALRRANRLGLRTKEGKEVNPQSFNYMLRKPVYAGWIAVTKWPGFKPIRGDFEPLVSQEIFDGVQRAMSGKNQLGKVHAKNHPDFPLRRFVKCGYCGHGLTGSWSTGRKDKFPYYRCSKCKKVNVRKERIEATFVSLLERLQPDEACLRLFEAVAADVWKTKQADAVAIVASHEQRLKDLMGKRDELDDAFLYQKTIQRETYDRHHQKIQAEIVDQQIALSEMKIDEMEVGTVLAFARHLLFNAHKLWFETPPEHRLRLQKVLFPEGLAFKDGNFGTAVTGVIFNVFWDSKSTKSKMATRHGLEP